MADDIIPYPHHGYSVSRASEGDGRITVLAEGPHLRIVKPGDTTGRAETLLLKSIHSLCSDAQEHLERVTRVLTSTHGYFGILTIDDNGIGTIVSSLPRGAVLKGSSLPLAERERRFSRCVEEVARLHKKSLAHGAIDLSSFWVTFSGEVILLPPMKKPFEEPLIHTQFRDLEELSRVYEALFSGDSHLPVRVPPRWHEPLHHLRVLHEQGEYRDTLSPVVLLLNMVRKGHSSSETLASLAKSSPAIAPPASLVEETLLLPKRSLGRRFSWIGIIGAFIIGGGVVFGGTSLTAPSRSPESIQRLHSLRDSFHRAKEFPPQVLLSTWSELLDVAGFHLSSKALARWVSRSELTNDTEYHHPAWAFAVDLSDSSLLPSRIYELALHSPHLVLELSAAMMLDSAVVGTPLSPSLEEAIREVINVQIKRSFESALGASIAVPSLWEDIKEVIPLLGTRISRHDLLELLSFATEHGNFALFSSAAQIALERGIWARDKAVLLSLFHQEKGRSLSLRYAMLNVLSGSAGLKDVRAFSEWPDAESSPFLWTVLLEAQDSGARDEAFFLVSRRAGHPPPVKILLEWIAANEWENRHTFMPLVAVVALSRHEALDASLARLSASSHRKKLIERLAPLANSPLIRALITLYADDFTPAVLIQLSRHGRQEVKMSALQKLVAINDAAIIKEVVEGYEKEQDETVREAYRTNFWYIQRRVGDSQK